jgi:hypothetical protein
MGQVVEGLPSKHKAEFKPQNCRGGEKKKPNQKIYNMVKKTQRTHI